jgi:hypothetical protein
MPVTVLYGGRPPSVTNASADGHNLWISLAELQKSTGWELKPQGACLNDVCVPIPVGREAEFIRASGKEFNLAALARLQGQPVVHDDTHNVWLFGDTGTARGDAMTSLQAPDFTLPDLNGEMHSLSQYRGKKILLVSWASW